MQRRRRPEGERFWSKVDRQGACWIWLGARLPRGYGLFGGDNSERLAHRIAWRQTHGPVPDGLQVLHRCDQPQCVNPSHLFLGTQAENMQDMHRKDRGQRGDRHWAKHKPERVQRGEARRQARLTAADVLTIRAEYAAGTTLRELARRYAYSEGSMHGVVNRRKWAHI